MDQKTALDVLKLGYNVYLTGPAGSGKTWLLNKYIDYLKSKGVEVAITASTGIAATHMNGITIHSWSGISTKRILSSKDFRKIGRSNIIRKRIKKTGVLIIDEVSMLHAFQLDNVDQVLRHFREPFMAFGGLQVVLCGDLFQLPPVNKTMEPTRMVFQSEAWNKANFRICYLEEQKRQTDPRMIKILNDIRYLEVSDDTRDIVLSRMDAEIEGMVNPTKIYTHNRDVDHINGEELGKLREKPFSYTMLSGGSTSLSDCLKQGCLAPEKLVLKQGALVMFVKNNFEEGYVNGTVGKVVGFDVESRLPIVQLKTGKSIRAEPAMWIYEEGEKIKAWIKQIPLRLAWAITVHKSQGMTLDAAEVDLSKSFECGMGYVALSRVKELSGLKLLGINDRAFQVDENISEFDNHLLYWSDMVKKEMNNMNKVTKFFKQKRFLQSVQKGCD